MFYGQFPPDGYGYGGKGMYGKGGFPGPYGKGYPGMYGKGYPGKYRTDWYRRRPRRGRTWFGKDWY